MPKTTKNKKQKQTATKHDTKKTNEGEKRIPTKSYSQNLQNPQQKKGLLSKGKACNRYTVANKNDLATEKKINLVSTVVAANNSIANAT